jgi:DNA mismatch repair ATPase MutS
LPAVAFTAPLAVQLVLVFLARNETARVFTAVSSTEGAFLRYGTMLELVENLKAGSALLASLRDRLRGGETALLPSQAMKDFRRKVGWFDLRHNGLIHPFVNLLLLWDIHCVLALERWQRRVGRATRGWFQALGDVEALASFSTLAYDEPTFSFPELDDGPAKFEATGLGHPLIDAPQRVLNDLALPGPGTALLVTGSNMSGKSTLLRAMGLAAVMALAGAPVCARQLRLTRLAVRTSIRISDSLMGGISHFYAELGKLKAVVSATDAHEPVFFLLDEILHGTNSRERQIGARWVLAELLQRGALGAVSTHDMALCQLPDDLMKRVTLVHFRESVADNKMTFDYLLRSGPVTSGNALRLMQLVGLDVPLE